LSPLGVSCVGVHNSENNIDIRYSLGVACVSVAAIKLSVYERDGGIRENLLKRKIEDCGHRMHANTIKYIRYVSECKPRVLD